MCYSTNINHTDNNAYIGVFHYLNIDFCAFIPEVQTTNIDSIRSMICHGIQSTGSDTVIAQVHNDKGRFDEDFVDDIQIKVTEQHDNSCDCLSSFVATTEARVRFLAGLPIRGSVITSSNQSIPCSDSTSNSNSNDVTNIINITGPENLGLLNGSTIVECAVSIEHSEW
jgi:hypothetical protein